MIDTVVYKHSWCIEKTDSRREGKTFTAADHYFAKIAVRLCQRQRLAILDCTVRVAVIVKALFVLIHRTEAHTHA